MSNSFFARVSKHYTNAKQGREAAKKRMAVSNPPSISMSQAWDLCHTLTGTTEEQKVKQPERKMNEWRWDDESPTKDGKFYFYKTMFYTNLQWTGSPSYARITFTGSTGTVRFTLMPLPSCCGIFFLHSPYWQKLREYPGGDWKEILYKEFHNFLNEHSTRNKLFISTYTTDPTSWKPFCEANGWTPNVETYNGNSGNTVVIYEFSRTKLIGKDVMESHDE